MTIPQILRIISVTGAPGDDFLADPQSKDGLVARVYSNRPAARLLARAPDFKEALEAILRVEICSDFPTNDDLLKEIRSIAQDTLGLLKESEQNVVTMHRAGKSRRR